MLTLVILQPDFGSTITPRHRAARAAVVHRRADAAVRRRDGRRGRRGAIALSVGAIYRNARLIAFFNPGADTEGANYQPLQAKYALADGGLFGQGLGQGAAKYGYLPNVHTDFIFALIGEELGFVGCALVLGLFGCWPSPACASPCATSTRGSRSSPAR